MAGAGDAKKPRLTAPPASLGETPEEMAWLEQLARIVNASVGSGTTANRPTTFLFEGRFYWDTDLDKPVFVKSVGPPAVWVDGVGTVS
jgi:hypothetical protein